MQDNCDQINLINAYKRKCYLLAALRMMSLLNQCSGLNIQL